jgi:SAM-dependent methyltransferase
VCHESVIEWVSAKSRALSLSALGPVLEVGSLNVNGTVRPFFKAEGYIGCDIVGGGGVDVVLADPRKLPFPDDRFEVVVSTEMLEHAEFPDEILAEMTRVCAHGGVVLVTTRSPGFPHHNPPDYRRYTVLELEEALRRAGLDEVSVENDPQVPGVFGVGKKKAPP